MIHRLIRQQIIPAPIADVWDYFSAPKNLNELTPPDMNFEIRFAGTGEIYPGQLMEYKVEFIRGLKSRWLTEITQVAHQAYFIDEQRIGPYRFWYHEHTFTSVEEGVKMDDLVTYALPSSLIGELVHWVWVKGRLKYIFDYRAQKIDQIFGVRPPETGINE